MKNRIIYLTPNEEKAVRLMAQGLSSREINNQCEIPLAGYAAFTLNIRRKTGIHDHHDKRVCQGYLDAYVEAMEKQAITPQQVEALRRYLRKETLEGIGYQMGRIGVKEVENLIDAACSAAGILTDDPRAQRMQIQVYLATFHSTNGKEVTPMELDILRHMAAGGSPAGFAQDRGERERYCLMLARSVCFRLGFNARGRGVQRGMIQDYLARIDSQQITMDDPAF